VTRPRTSHSTPTRAALAAALLLGLPLLAGCGGDSEAEESTSEQAREQAAEQELDTAADRSTCRAEAEAVDTPYADGFPQAWVFPPATTVYDVEDREGTGVIVTGISSAPFADILDFLNHDAVDAGFAVTEGETEEHDAEANWKSGDQVGRWAIRESADCPGETVIQVFAAAE
jgi:hypothetical protein